MRSLDEELTDERAWWCRVKCRGRVSEIEWNSFAASNALCKYLNYNLIAQPSTLCVDFFSIPKIKFRNRRRKRCFDLPESICPRDSKREREKKKIINFTNEIKTEKIKTIMTISFDWSKLLGCLWNVTI